MTYSQQVPAASFIKSPLVTDSPKTFTFSPISYLQTGSYLINITLTDYLGVFNTYTLALIVYDYPRFTTPVTSQITMRVNGNVNYTLPVYYESGLTLTSTNMPAFAQIYNNTFFDFKFLADCENSCWGIYS